MFKTIFQRLFWTSTAIIFFVVAAVSVSMLGLLNRYVVSERLSSARRASESIEYLTAAIAVNEYDSYYRHVYDSTIASWSHMIGADIAVLNARGEVFSSTNSRYTVPKSYSEKIFSGEAAGGAVYGNPTEKLFLIGLPISYNGSVMGGVFYFYPSGFMQSTVREFSSMIFLSLLAAMFISICIVFLEARHISKPLKEINSAVLEIASGKFDKRVNVAATDEISQLASSFNYMADSLKQLEEMRTSFISDISHELRTPMTSISGFVQGILDGTVPKEKEREYLNIVLEESTRLARLTNEMFEMTKMTSPEYKLSVKKFDINEAIRLCIISAEQKIEAKGLELDVRFESDTVNVLADPDAIKRVLINLLDNAIKFSAEGTTVIVSVYEKNRHVYVDFTDYGIGIPEKDLQHIFDRFYKTDKSRGRDKSGAGLGLSFVKNILTLHSQQITAESVPAEDGKMKTTFSFTLERA